jgi:hypothetical protein
MHERRPPLWIIGRTVKAPDVLRRRPRRPHPGADRRSHRTRQRGDPQGRRRPTHPHQQHLPTPSLTTEPPPHHPDRDPGGLPSGKGPGSAPNPANNREEPRGVEAGRRPSNEPAQLDGLGLSRTSRTPAVVLGHQPGSQESGPGTPTGDLEQAISCARSRFPVRGPDLWPGIPGSRRWVPGSRRSARGARVTLVSARRERPAPGARDPAGSRASRGPDWRRSGDGGRPGRCPSRRSLALAGS